MGRPPVSAGACQLNTESRMREAVALTAVGASGTPEGTTALEATETGPSPTALWATTRNVYEVPLVRPLTTMGLLVPLPGWFSGVEVTVYAVIAVPPSDAGATNATE